MSRDENVRVVLECFVAVEQRDEQRQRQLFHPDVEFHWPPALLDSSQAENGERSSFEEVWDPLPTAAQLHGGQLQTARRPRPAAAERHRGHAADRAGDAAGGCEHGSHTSPDSRGRSQPLARRTPCRRRLRLRLRDARQRSELLLGQAPKASRCSSSPGPCGFRARANPQVPSIHELWTSDIDRRLADSRESLRGGGRSSG
jgi:ketosteroid isomerase-like protein